MRLYADYINRHEISAIWPSLTMSNPMPATAPSDAREIVVFDFDGTITTKDTFALFLRYYAGPIRWAVNILILLPIFAAYGLKIIDRNAVKAHVIKRFFKGEQVSRVTTKAERFAKDVIPTLIRPQAQDCLDRKKQAGESLYICSASIAPYLRAWGASQGITQILATELESEGEHYTGAIKGYNIWGQGKVRRILAEFAPNTITIKEAYGDSRGDRELLHAAQASYYRPFRL